MASILLISLSWPLSGGADNRTAYFDALKLAQSKVDRQKHVAGEHGLSTSLLGQFLGRPYQVGDSWKVAVWSPDPSIMRQTGDPQSLRTRRARTGIFNYEVTEIQGTSAAPVVIVRVTEQSLDGVTPPQNDARVDSIELKISLDGGFRQTGKTYILKEGRKFVASADGVHAPVSYLELFPLEAPELGTASRGEIRALPSLPAELVALAGGTAPRVDPDHAARFEQDDFFGRQIEVVWRQGDPWPVYQRTTNGTALLISQSTTGGNGR